MYYFIGAHCRNMLFLAQFLKELGYDVICDSKDNNKDNAKCFRNAPLDNTMKVIKADDVVVSDERLLQAQQLNLKIYSYQAVINYLVVHHKAVLVLENSSHFLSILLTDVLDELKGCNCLIAGHCAKAKRGNPYMLVNMKIEEISKKNGVVFYAVINEKNEKIRKHILKQHKKLNKTQKIILVYGDHLSISVDEIQKPIFFYGLDKYNDIVIKNLEKTTKGYLFDIYLEENFYGRFDLPVANKKQLIDIMAVIAICYYERFPAKDVSRCLKKLLPTAIKSR